VIGVSCYVLDVEVELLQVCGKPLMVVICNFPFVCMNCSGL
jgi:hypothetical protein